MNFREGPVGALLDIYEQEINHLSELLKQNFTSIEGSDSAEEWTMKRILTHVLSAGFHYTLDIRDQWGGQELEHPEKLKFDNIDEYLPLLEKMFEYMELSMKDKHEFKPEYIQNPISTRWGQKYDIEQNVEHAIVHIQRHQRQIRKLFLSDNH